MIGLYRVEPVIVLAQHPATPDVPAAAVVRTVAISDAAFSPSALVVAPGTTVTWTNDGRSATPSPPTAAPSTPPPSSPATGSPSPRPATTGVYAYHCKFHSFMRGTRDGVARVAGGAGAGRPSAAARRSPAPCRAPTEGTAVHFERRLPGAWEEVGVATTDAGGAYHAHRAAAHRAHGVPGRRGRRREPEHPRRRPARRDRHAHRRAARGAGAPRRRRGRAPGAARPGHLPLGDGRRAAASAGRARFTLGAPGVYRAMVEARGGLSEAASRVVQFRPGAFRE